MSWIVAALCALQAPADAVEPQDPDRPAYSLADLKALRESNLFAPHRRAGSTSSKPSTGSSEPRPPAPPARPKPIQVTGFILDPATKTPRAILEDRNDEKTRTLKEPLFAKAGDTAGGWTVEEVTPEQLTIVQGETKKTLRVGESFPDTGAPASAAPAATAGPDSATGSNPAVAPPSAEAGDAAKNDILERLKSRNKKKRSDEP